MPIPCVKLDRGLHVIHLFYRLDREKWAALSESARRDSRLAVEKLCQANNHPCAPRVTTYVNLGNKADIVFFILARELADAGALQQQAASCFPPGTLQSVFSYFSVTELSEYTTSDEENQQMLVREEKLEPGSEPFDKRMGEIRARMAQYEHYRLYPELPEWEVMAFYPMSKKRSGGDNWYSLDFEARKKMMGGHARVGRKYAGRISQLITGSTGLDDWEWGVTLMAHQVDAVKEIVYEMRFDEVTARFGDFGPFFVNLRLAAAELFEYLRL